MMQRNAVVIVAAMLVVPAWFRTVAAQPMDVPLLVGGQDTIFADTSANGCPDPGDMACSVALHQPIPSTETITCNFQGPLDFTLTQFDPTLMSYMATMPNGANYSTFIQRRSNGPVGVVSISTLNGSGTGTLCTESGRIVTRVTASTSPPLLFGMEFVNCANCPNTACVPDPNTPTHLRSVLVFPLQFLGAPSLYLPLVGKTLSFTEGGKVLGQLDLDQLGPCALEAAAPTLTTTGLMLTALALLVIGSWGLGRRQGFAELPLP
jgi:hypothetical protein